jgi:hypothetical protein
MAVASLSVNLRANTSQVTTELEKMKTSARAAMRETQKEIQESNHSLGLFGEAFGVTVPRHIRTFVSELPGVSKAMSAAFDAIAIFVVIKVIAEAAEKVKQLKEAWDEHGKKAGEMAKQMGEVLIPIRNANDALEVQKDAIQKSIDKLEHKPHNAIKDAIDEAIVSADTLVEKLSQSAQKVSDLLRKQSVSSTWGFITGQGATTDVSRGWDNFSSRMEQTVEHFRDELVEAKSHGSSQEQLNEITGNARTALTKVFEDYRKEYQSGDPNHIGYMPYNQAVLEQKKYNPNSTTPGADYSKTIQALSVVNYSAQQQLQHALGEFDLGDLKKRQGVDQAAAANKKDTTKGDEAEKRLIGIILEGLADANARYDRALQLPSVRPGNEEWAYGVKNPDTGMRQGGEFAKLRAAAYKEDEAEEHKDLEEFNRFNNKLNAENDRLASIHEKEAKDQEEHVKKTGEIAAKWIEFRQKTGALSQPEASKQLTAAHTSEFTQMMSILVANRDRIAAESPGARSDGDLKVWQERHTEQLQKANGAISTAQDAFGLQHAQDTYNQSMQTAGRGFHEFFTEFTNDANNSAATVKNIMSTTVNGINAQIANAMMGKKTSFHKVFEQAGSSMIQSGLKKGESAVASAFGMGKQGSSPLKPMFVSVVSGLGGLGQAGGGILSGLKHLFGFAAGGDPDPYGISMVGEKGPELFIPHGVSGTIIPNDRIGSFGSSKDGSTYNIDARGTNASEVDMRVRQGMIMAHNQAVQSSAMAQQERARRMPSSKRGGF